MNNVDRSDEEDIKFVERAVAMLSEHFDTVQIMCTRGIEQGKTVQVNKGSGNWFARYGGMREWVIKEEEAMREQARISERDNEE